MFQEGFQPDAAATYDTGDLPEPQSTPQDDSQLYDWNYPLYPILNQDNMHWGTHCDLDYNTSYGIDPMATASIEHYGFGVPSETPLLGTSYPGPGMGVSDGWPGYNLGYAMPEDLVIAGTQDTAEGSNDEGTTMSMEWTPSQQKKKSKLGRHEQEVPVETGPPGLGLSPSYAMGSTPMESASGNPGQAWEEGSGNLSGSMESPQDEAGALARLMVRVKGSWRCTGCNGKKFYDRSTLKRHCRSKHSNNPGMKDCPYCDKSYTRQYGVNRHIRKKHAQSGVGEGSTTR